MDRLTSLVADVEFSLQNDLHLVIGISINKGSAFLEPVDTAADGLLGVDALIARDIAEKGVLICDQRRLEFRLNFGEMFECWGGSHFSGGVRMCCLAVRGKAAG